MLLVDCDTEAFVDAAAGRTPTKTGTSLSSATPTHTGFGNVLNVGAVSRFVTYPASTDFSLVKAAGDFTIEFWQYTASTNAGLMSISGVGTAGWELRTINGPPNYLQLNARNAAGNTLTMIDTYMGAVPTTATWTHIVLQRLGSTTTVWINGTRTYNSATGYNTYDQNTAVVSAHTLTIGALASNSLTCGAIDDFRFSRIARYDNTQTTITVPSEPYAKAGTAMFLPLNTVGSAVADGVGRVWTNNGAASITSGTGHV